jgi:UDP:flavonoid glycosyltransferase YjiC (YdhE family)
MTTLVDVMTRKQEWQLVIVTGGGADISRFKTVTSNIILTEFAPQLKLLEISSLMITHGGINSIKECIYFGVPLILYPQIRDQTQNAARVMYHKLGVRVNLQELSASQISSLIDQVNDDPSCRANIRQMSARFKDIENSQPSVQIIESILQRS